LKQLRSFDVTTVIGALRLYLLELPECLCTFSLYEPVKALYKQEDDNVDLRLQMIRTMLMNMPTANFYTLNRLMKHLHK
jgi:hypothetical protein